MARDRQRSKARQRARASGDQPTPPKRRRRDARDNGLDDATIEDSGLIADTTPPELEGAFPNVDEAHLAEAGADIPAPDDSDEGEDFDRAEDQVEIPRDLVQTPRHRAGEADDHHPVEHKDRGRVITFIRACVDELRRVQWPDRKHVFSATAVVLGFVLIAGGWLGLMDAIWQPLINALL